MKFTAEHTEIAERRIDLQIYSCLTSKAFVVEGVSDALQICSTGHRDD